MDQKLFGRKFTRCFHNHHARNLCYKMNGISFVIDLSTDKLAIYVSRI